MTLIKLWKWLNWCFLCAAQAEATGQRLDPQWLQAIDDAASRLASSEIGEGSSRSSLIDVHQKNVNRRLAKPDVGKSSSDYHWANTEPGRCGIGANFITLCVQRNITSLIESRVEAGSRGFHCDDEGRPLLDYALLDHPDDQQSEATDLPRDGTSLPCDETIPPLKMITLLLKGGADPNAWYADGTPWTRTLTKLHAFHQRASVCKEMSGQILSRYQEWYEVFVVFIKGGADPRCDLDCPGGGGSYAKETFRAWDEDKMRTLLQLMRRRQRKLPILGNRLVGRVSS